MKHLQQQNIDHLPQFYAWNPATGKRRCNSYSNPPHSMMTSQRDETHKEGDHGNGEALDHWDDDTLQDHSTMEVEHCPVSKRARTSGMSSYQPMVSPDVVTGTTEYPSVMPMESERAITTASWQTRDWWKKSTTTTTKTKSSMSSSPLVQQLFPKNSNLPGANTNNMAATRLICVVCHCVYNPNQIPQQPKNIMPENALLAYFPCKMSHKVSPHHHTPAMTMPQTTTPPSGWLPSDPSTTASRTSIVTCIYCERPACPDCMSECERCHQIFCSFCSTQEYGSTYTRTFCLDCYRDAAAAPGLAAAAATAVASTTTSSSSSSCRSSRSNWGGEYDSMMHIDS